MSVVWRNVENIPSHSYTCGYCDHPIASEKGYVGLERRSGTVTTNIMARIYICHRCTLPSLFGPDYNSQTPSPRYGRDVEYVTDPAVKFLYKEARDCVKVGAYTASVMCSRKLLMNIAVSKGADKKESFTYYVGYLHQNNYTPPDSEHWVEHIRKRGNEANHEINPMTRDDATELLSFIEMLLIFIYELPGRMQQHKPSNSSPTA